MRLFLLLGAVGVCNAGFLDFLSNLSGSKSNSRSSSRGRPGKTVTDDDAKQYLNQFGYVNVGNSLNASPGGRFSADLSSAKDILKSAILKFQEFAGLRRTGELDDMTKKKMAEPRCGMQDVLAVTSGGAAFKWRKNRVTYSIENYSSDLPRDQVRRAISEAYAVWSKVTPLEFEEVSSNGDIKVRFGSRNHGDPWPFDGEGGVLAHATMPENGALHFDDDESWAYRDAAKIGADYTDILAVAIHEGGHTLGLSHSRDETSIMAPFYQRTVDDNGNYNEPRLKQNDIESIQDIYGARTGGSSSGSRGDWGSSGTTTSRPTTTKSSWLDRFFGRDGDSTTTTQRPSWGGSGGSSSGGWGDRGGSSGGDCPSRLDAITQTDNGHSYLFQGSRVYELTGNRVVKTYSLQQLFPNAPSTVQAAVFNPNSGITMLFSGGMVYGYYYSRIRGTFSMDMEYPKRLPSKIGFNPNGAMRWSNGHQILLSSGDDFAVYDEFWNQSTLENKLSNYFPNWPNGIKGASVSSGGVTAFSPSTVFTYNERSKTTTDQMPLSAWIRC